MKSTFWYSCFLVLISLWAIRAQPPSGTLSASSTTVCSGKTLSFTLFFNPSNASVQWKLPYGTTLLASQPTMALVQFNQAGIKTLSVVLANGNGSIQLASTHTVIASARASFLAKAEHSAVPAAIHLTNYSTSFLQTHWVLDNNFSSPLSGTQTSVFFNSPGTHSLTLVAIGQSGCNDTNTYVIRLFDKSSLRLPNIFTPNNDGVNDVFRPIMEGIKYIHVMIFNRWGLMVKEWNQLNGFWDGYTSADMPCVEGTYFVICEAEGVDGVRYSLKSSLQLVR
ncbi:MAG: gliding motility-associated C-terminal domain-containing protein [Bacteroidia bacterium]|nr:gliding motility-associated C-terminal domain-containing protein [Bacteroidia bacterium]